MTRQELYQNWTKQDYRTLVHKTMPRTKISLVPEQPGRCGRHFIVMVNGRWVLQGRFIRPFATLKDALGAVKE